MTWSWCKTAVLLYLSTFFLTPNLAHAEGHITAIEHYQNGNLVETIHIARQDGSPNSLALAAQAQFIVAQFFAEGTCRLALIKQSQDDLSQAPEPSPLIILQSAISWGLHARYTGKFSSVRKSKNLLEQVLELEPDNPWALAALGGWHGEVVAKAGGFIGMLFFGARRKHMSRLFNKAMSIKPDDIPLLTAMSSTLLRLSRKAEVEQATEMLNHVSSLEHEGVVDLLLQNQANALLSALAEKNRNRLSLILEHYEPQVQVTIPTCIQ